MPKRYALYLLLLAMLPFSVRAQDAQAPTHTARFLAHFDLGVAGTAFFTKDVTGNVNESVLGPPYSITQSTSTAAGVLATLRGQKSPYKGVELNYGYARTTETYTCGGATASRCNLNAITGTSTGPFQTQATAAEYTFGYLVRPPHPVFGFQPYASVGAGSLEFKPTRNGGQGLQTQARAAYYYSVGGESLVFGDSVGIRAGVRQLIYLAPDFGQNYLTIKKYTFTTEPQVGVYLHF